MNFNAEGLVIKETSYGDNDKILTVLMRGKGKIQVWARGCKRIKSPLLSVSHVFTYADFSVFENRDSLSVRSAEIIDNFYSLRDRLERLALAEYVAETVCKSTMDNSECDGVLNLALNTLYLLAKSDRRTDLIKACFEMRLMTELGYLPVLDSCCECGNTEGRMSFDVPKGGMVCLGHGHGIEVSGALLRALAHICHSESKLVFSFALGDDNMRSLSEICEKYLVYHLGFEPGTLSFYKNVAEVQNK